MASYPFRAVNVTSDVPPPSATSFTFSSSLSENIPTNISRSIKKPTGTQLELTVDESRTLFNAPIVYKRFGLPSFKRLRATVSIHSLQLKARDQVGLVFVLPSACATEDGGNSGNREHVGRWGHWVKIFLTLEGDETYVKTFVCDRWEDISLLRTHRGMREGGYHDMTIELSRNDHDASLWVFLIEGEEKIPIREIPWIIHKGGNVEGTSIQQAMREAWAGCYCARPSSSAQQSTLLARVSDFDLIVKSPEQMKMST